MNQRLAFSFPLHSRAGVFFILAFSRTHSFFQFAHRLDRSRLFQDRALDMFGLLHKIRIRRFIRAKQPVQI